MTLRPTAGLDVLAFDPGLPNGAGKALGVERTDDLRELLGRAHCVSLHCTAQVTPAAVVW